MTTTITASMVKELRERTGAGMMECKKALTEANGDMESAIESMRKAGIAKAAKKAGRIAAEGNIAVKISDDAQSASMVEVNCETDFVARDQNFLNFSALVAQTVLETRLMDVQALSAVTPGQSSSTLEQIRLELVNKLGENVQIRRAVVLTADEKIGTYVHGGRIGALVALSAGSPELAKDIAMHVAASNPIVISPESVPQELIEKETEIFKAQSLESGKPLEIVEKMVSGRINKFLAEISLLGQPFVKEPNITVGNWLKQHHAQVTGFFRFEVGEGIEKPVEDFAKAVMDQISGGNT